jgi:hypothetical protein
MSPQDDEERARGGVRREYSLPLQATREDWSKFRYLPSNLSSNGPKLFLLMQDKLSPGTQIMYRG